MHGLTFINKTKGDRLELKGLDFSASKQGIESE